ncbi:MAG: MarR family transcriptional regulator [Pseudonocardia sp.]|jgi:DNA-binding MarR family transcriptional regulator|nr:MarR family transcriptional regulator [Pseudonocardia sp.]MDT7704355.1 MarR family transcriptional regulator, organic hydroperoxide resistance regulator [Pseudonocardiales bacterium]
MEPPHRGDAFYAAPMADTPGSSFTVAGQLCFALHSASRAMTGCYRPLLEAVGLTYSQYTVMLVLWEHGTVTLGRLGEQLYLDSGTLSPLLKRLEAQGVVTRRRRLDDERVVEIRLTTAGAELEAKAQAVQGRVEEATGLTELELATLRDDLQRLAARLRAAEIEPESAAG